jgi:flagellar basal-body rod modification protein FlgD
VTTVAPTATAPAAKTAKTADTSTPTNKKAMLGKDDFLKLLVAQLKYQNPMSPSDSSQMMAQSAQYAMVEQLTQLSSSTTELLSEQRWTSATSMLGKTITWSQTDTDGNAVSKTGVVSGVKAGSTSTAPTLLVGDKEVPSTAVTSVTTAAAVPATPAAPSPSTSAT